MVEKYTGKHVTEKTQERIEACGDWIDFLADYDVTKLKVHNAMFCKNRFCPMCAWRKSHKDAMKVSILMDYIKEELDKDFIFVTLTSPNVKGEDLINELDKYQDAFKALMNRVNRKTNVVHGYLRKLEVTYNAERDDYHPHYHVIFAVNKSYFKGKTYLKQEKWLKMWREVMHDESITQVDVRRAYGDGGKSGKGNAVREIAKYAVKDSDYTISQEIFDVFYLSLKGRRMLSYGGMFAEANAKYKLGELNKYKTVDTTEYVWVILQRWKGKEYVEKERRAATEDDFRDGSLDEMSIM